MERKHFRSAQQKGNIGRSYTIPTVNISVSVGLASIALPANG